MNILSIETSCDETAVSIVEAERGLQSPTFKVLGNALYSQVSIHKEYGGVYPMLAKREHARNLPHLLDKVLKEANLISNFQFSISKEDKEKKWKEIEKILEREEGLYQSFKETFESVEKPNLDVIAVTRGPGLEPALWVGISFAVALGKLWNIPVMGVNHMEGHIASVLIKTEEFSIPVPEQSSVRDSASNSQFSNKIEFPALAVLISGGHTEIVKIDSWGKYKVIGETVDDAVGEAFDKVARLLGLPYPGGPEISKLAEMAREKNIEHKVKLPRPMLHSKTLDFSFSGLKTAVLYYIRDNFSGDYKNMSNENKADLAREFEDAVIDVLREKTNEALKNNEVKTLIIAGGVIANKKLRQIFDEFEMKYSGLVVKVPEKNLATDNSLMISVASYMNILLYPELLNSPQKIIAKGNLKFE